MLDFETDVDQREELEAALFLVVMCVLAFLSVFAFVVVQVTRWWMGA